MKVRAVPAARTLRVPPERKTTYPVFFDKLDRPGPQSHGATAFAQGPTMHSTAPDNCGIVLYCFQQIQPGISQYAME